MTLLLLWNKYFDGDVYPFGSSNFFWRNVIGVGWETLSFLTLPVFKQYKFYSVLGTMHGLSMRQLWVSINDPTRRLQPTPDTIFIKLQNVFLLPLYSCWSLKSFSTHWLVLYRNNIITSPSKCHGLDFAEEMKYTS